ncbi:MAG TPA: hypothetical protein VKV36_10495 [Acidimicrobiales bacterium]|nr:hypothetical protein [Acidimicrobiales bacterium]
MVALMVVVVAAVALLGVLVTGLLRSHADILSALHALGAGVGDPSREPEAGSPLSTPARPVPVSFGPPLPAERSSTAPDLAGVTPGGDAVALAMGTGADTLLAFLSSGCTTCEGFWSALGSAHGSLLPADLRLVVVTKGPELESPPAVRALAKGAVEVVMSTSAWVDYEVPGSPFFALVDGTRAARIGEGFAGSLEQVLGLVAQARRDRVGGPGSGRAATPAGRGSPGPPAVTGLTGPERERDNDERLLAAGIGPGHPSLYPAKLGDVLAPTVPVAGASGEG